ncbi:alanine racemase [Deinococcus cellulosilyticus NBRC 106333 = KACC 11606]|uniref:Alanine racemase n=2 Tax=Deinococcus cellulosilyticus TaxID=401558 RepID=A0A511N4M8_DEIC1|nr:alanine racemase [Deinococcus cellulosilyticus NBRC 106333 = KACC 11606]
MLHMTPRVIAEIHLAHLHANLQALARHAGSSHVLLPIKANAYGHSAALVAQHTSDWKLIWGYAVAAPEEALEILPLTRKPVVLFTPSALDESAQLARMGVRLTISSLEELLYLPAGSRIHLKVNTGMNRLGMRPEEVVRVAQTAQHRGVIVEGVFSHFASADAPEPESARQQLALFREVRASLEQAGLPGLIYHMSNSAGIEAFGPEAAFNLIRPGIAAYGFTTRPEAGVPLKPVMRLMARIGYLHTMHPGEKVSYGELWTAQRETLVATLQIGYADGYPRSATGHARARLGSDWRDIIGRICMDQCMMDVTGLKAQVGDYVEVMGFDQVTATDLAPHANTIEYEVLTGINARRVQYRAIPAPEHVQIP